SHPNFEEQIDIVNQTLLEIDARHKPTYIVFNKIDAFRYVVKEEDDLSPDTRENISLDDLRKTWMAKSNGSCVFISAKKLENIKEIRDLLYEKVKEIHAKRYPYDDFLY
ncbi:MAG: GTPase HflX, partial [Bacteroidales bacterium]